MKQMFFFHRGGFDFFAEPLSAAKIERMNIPRVIYLDQNVVVDVCECMRPSKCKGREIGRQLRREIERCVEDGLAIFPYSEVHLSEAANVTDPESRAEQIRFWKNL